LDLQKVISEIIEHIRGMWRYRWWAIGTAWLLSLVGNLYVFSIPDVYLASAKVFVDTNSLLRPLMQGLTATSNTMNEVELVSKAVLTRPNLETVAYETDLALRATTPAQMEELVTYLQTSIHISGGRDNIFSISYEDVSHEKARDVVAAVVDSFIEGAQGNEGNDSEVTGRALANEIEVHEKRLREAEDALARFKQDNLGYMPGEYGDYYSRLQATLAGVGETEEKLRQLAERRDELQRQIDGEAPVYGIMAGSAGPVAQCGSQIGTLKTQLAALRVNFTEKHPRVVSLEETIAQLEAECRAQSPPAGSAGAPVDGAQQLNLNPVYQALRVQLSTADVDLVELRGRLEAGQAEVARLRRDVDKITEVEAQLKQLNRDYGVVQERHQELLKRWEDLQAKKRLDPMTDAVQFRRIEPPFAQADPVGPNRPLMLAAVLVAALAGGGGLAFALNQVWPVFFTRTRLQKVAGFPVLGTISMILAPDAVLRRRLSMAGWMGAVIVLLVSTAVWIVFARQGASFLQSIVPGMGA
jgi:protein tyrosine kinase modulator